MLIRDRYRVGVVFIAALSSLCLGCASVPDDTSSQTPLTGLIGTNGPITQVRDLLASGADPDELNSAGLSPMTLAVQVGRPDVVEVLVDAGALVDGPLLAMVARFPVELDHPHRPPEERFVELAQLLLAEGADPCAVFDDDLLPSQIALERGRSELAELLGAAESGCS